MVYEDHASSPRERGRLGARRRWGETPRIVRLDDLTPPQRRLVLALVDAAKAETEKAAAVSETPATAETEVRGGSLDSAA